MQPLYHSSCQRLLCWVFDVHRYPTAIMLLIIGCCFLFQWEKPAFAEQPTNLNQQIVEAPAASIPSGQEVEETMEMLSSLLELQHSLQEQIQLTQKKYKQSNSETEKSNLAQELEQLDKQLSETSADFERIATGVESALFVEKKPETFQWKEELASLVEPAIKELKRFTIRARKKSSLKESISEFSSLSQTAHQAVAHLEVVLENATDNKMKMQVKALLPEWKNIEKRLQNKLELAQLELDQLHQTERSLVESSRHTVRAFFRDRGFYLIVALLTFVAVLLSCRLLYRLFVFILHKLRQSKQRSFQLRLLDIIFQVASIVLAVAGLFFVLYLAEDWFLLSMAIIFFLGVFWTIRQGLPRLWQQGRLMLNIGSVREGERLVLYDVPWRVRSLNVFCILENPTLDVQLRIPIESLVGLSSRPHHHDEPWFPCKKGDWVVVGGAPRGRVVSLSHEQVELVQRGGKRVTYPTRVFLDECPVNLSRNFRLRVVFGVSYSLQEQICSSIPAILKEYLQQQIEIQEWAEQCLNIRVEFCQANSSSLDLIILADFKGELADISKRIERTLNQWCVQCATENDWEIPFPQLSVHLPVNTPPPVLTTIQPAHTSPPTG